ncbi:MAG: alpha-L-fucosidase [Bryobacteraceae bacterium]
MKHLPRREFVKSLASAPLVFAAGRYARAQARYTADWNSLDRRPTPSWYTEAKFGVFIHWGVYAVPSYAPPRVKGETPYAEWYWHSLTEGKKAKAPGDDGYHTWQFHRRVYGADFRYQDFAPLFRAELFDPYHWADAIARSGARYVALTSKHHEGFTLWRSAEANRSWGRPWNAVDIGPRRDLLAELTEAGRSRGLHMGIYYSLYEWYNPLWLADRARYVTEHMMPQFKDVVSHARPDLIFSDGEWDLTSDEWHAPELLAWLFNESPARELVVMNDRWGKDTRQKHGGYFTTEYTSGMSQSAHPWEENRGMGYSYGYNRVETLGDYRSSRELLLMLLDIVSRGGNLLLDIGPTADGRIPVIMEERLVQIGDWLRPNGAAIYGARPWKRSRQWSAGQVPKLEEKEFMSDYPIGDLVDTPRRGFARVDAFFTAKGNTVYAILPRKPVDEVVLTGLTPRAEMSATLSDTGQKLAWTRRGDGIALRVPDSVAASLPPAEAYVIEMAGAE